MLNSNAIGCLTTKDELAEIEAVFGKKIESKAIVGLNKAIPKGVVKLKRSFTMNLGGKVLKFWRVVGPIDHSNYMSDLSLEGLKEWGII